MLEIASETKASVCQAKERLTRLLETTPDDRINWSPSSTCRTPVQLVAHAALAMKHIGNTLDGRKFETPTTSEADLTFREWERQFSTREEVLNLLDRNCAAFEAWLDALTPERLETLVEMPFGLGFAPVKAVLHVAAGHMMAHVAQLEYVQTVYGDQDWHL